MVFSSLLFVFAFLALNLIAYFFAGSIKRRNMVLLTFSIVFYSWGGPKYLILLLGMTWVSWFTARQIERQKEKKKRWLIVECVVMLGLLGFFKYTGFFLENIRLLTGFPREIPEIVLPIGISFYTFQLLSYVIDVYRGEVAAQPKYWKLLLYSSLFHQCIAGPIVRYQTVAEEIEERKITYTDLSDGIRRFSVGLAKKAILANSCASVADTLLQAGLEGLMAAPTLNLWLGMAFYMLQIYLDFSAYSDMAIGMGRMVGFHYLENFNYPYIAKSVQDFWRRWHISLSTFFRDYVYIPLGGSRAGNWITVRNMLCVWGLTGLWHGASWNYVLWGLYMFLFLMGERFLYGKALKKIPAVGHIYAVIVIFFGWVLFKFENMEELLTVFSGMFGGGHVLSSPETDILFKYNMFLLAFSIIAVTPAGKYIRNKWYELAGENKKIPYVMMFADMVLPALLLVLSAMALVGNSYNPFLYFQF